MSVDNYKFTCPTCGREEKQCEGSLLFDDKCYVMLQCPECKKVDSVQLNEEQERNKIYPQCCGVKMVEWDKRCPSCGEKMEVIEWVSDVI